MELMRVRYSLLSLLTFLFTACTPAENVETFPTPASVEIRTQTPIFTSVLPTVTITPAPTPESIIVPTSTPNPTITATPTSLPTYTPTSTVTPNPPPTSIPIKPKNSKREKRIVFAAGLCTNNSRDAFVQYKTWISKNMGYEEGDFDYYNYSLNGRSGEDYDPAETLKSVDDVTDKRVQSEYLKGSSAENFRNFMMRLSSAHKNAEFYIIAHSLGGVVAVYSFDTYPELRKIVRGIMTIDSPLRGEGVIKLNEGRIFTCVKNYEDVKHLVPIPVFVDLTENSQVIRDIDIDYSTTGTRVVTFANSTDPLLVSNKYRVSGTYFNGVLGTLDGAMKYVFPFAGKPSDNIIDRYASLRDILKQHGIALTIIDLENNGKKDEANFIGEAIRCTLIGDNCAYSKRK